MTDLQLSLLALGALIIVCVVLFNWWQERAMRKASAELFDSPTQHHSRDVLMDDFKIDTEALLIKSGAHSDRFEDSSPSARRTSAGHSSAVHPSESQSSARYAIDQQDCSDQQHYTEDEDVRSMPPASTLDRQLDSAPEVRPVEPSPAASPASIESMHAAYSGLNAISPVGQPSSAQPNTLDPYATAEDISGADVAELEPDSGIDEHERYHSLPDGISHQIDLVAILYLQHPASGAALREIVPALSALDKPVYAHGLDADYVWHFLTREQEHKQFIRAAYSLQLADRSGPVSSATLNQFQQTIDTIGHIQSAQIEWQGNPHPLDYAQELDQFCIDVDKMVGFHIVQGPNGPFTGTKFRGLAEASGLVLGENGAFNYVNENGVLYSLVNQDNSAFTPDMLRSIVLHGISFQLDIPRVKNCAEVFNQMVLAAKQMEHSLNASLVDDHQRPLGEGQIEKIRQQLKVIHSQMVARGVVPGSPTALRLFS